MLMITTLALAASSALIGGPEPEDDPGQPHVEITVTLQRFVPDQDREGWRLRVTDPDGAYVKPQGGAAGASVFIGEGIDTMMYGYLEAISSPRIITGSGQEAEIVVGEAISYVELADDTEELRLVEQTGAIEGLSITAHPVAMDNDGVRFDELEVTLSEVIGRLDITSPDGARTLTVPGGRPIMRHESFSLPISLSPGTTAIVLLNPASDQDHPFVVRIKASVLRTWTATD